MTRFQLPTAVATLLFTVWVPGVVAAAESIPVVPPEPEQIGVRAGSDSASKAAASASLPEDPVSEVLRLRGEIKANRERIEGLRSSDLKQADEAYRSALASIAPKDMFETEAEHLKRDVQEKSEAALEKAKSDSAINQKYDALLRSEVEPPFQRVRTLLDGADVISSDAITVHLEKYDPEHAILVGGLEVVSDLVETKARLIVPMKREDARTFWKNRQSLVGKVSMSMDVRSLDVDIEEFWLEDPRSGSRTKERVAVLELRLPSPGKTIEGAAPSEEEHKRAKPMRAAASSLAKRAAQTTYKDWTGQTSTIRDEKAKGRIAEYNRLVGEAKAVFAKDPHIQGLKMLVYGGNNAQASRAVEAAAKGLEAYLTSFVSNDAFKASASLLTKRAAQTTYKDRTGQTSTIRDEKAKGRIAEYNRLVGETKAVFAKDPHIQGLKMLVYGGNNAQASRAVEAAAKGLEAYLTSFVSNDAFKASASLLAKRAAQTTYKDWTGQTSTIRDEKAKGRIAEYNRLVGETKAVFAKDPHIQGLKILVYGGNNAQASRAVEAAAKGLEAYLTSFVSNDAFKASASLLAKRAAQTTYKDWTGQTSTIRDEKAKGRIAEYNRLVGETKAVFAKDPHIQGLKILVYGGNNAQASRAVEAAAKGLEAYLTSFVSNDAFKASASLLAKRAAQTTYKDWTGQTSTIRDEKAKGRIAEYNRLVGEAKAVFAKDPHIQGLKMLVHGGDNAQASRAVEAASRILGRAMENVTETPREVATEAVADAKSPSPSYTLLEHLPYSGRFSPDAFKLAGLLGRWFSPDAKDESGWTDLHYAAALNLPGLASALLDAGAKPDTTLKNDGQDLSADLLATLSAFGLNLDGWRRYGEVPLHFAAWFNAGLAAPHLIAGGAEVGKRDGNKHTPLYLAAWQNSRSVAELLIGLGADVQANSSRGMTPLDAAIHTKASGTAELIQRHGGLCNNVCQ